MPAAAALRLQIERALAIRFPSALTPAPCTIREVAPTGIEEADRLLDGGLPVGAISEINGTGIVGTYQPWPFLSCPANGRRPRLRLGGYE